MRKLIASLVVFTSIAGVSYFVGSARGQGAKPAVEIPHKVGLIDMQNVFQQYEKHKVLTEELNGEMRDARGQFKSRMERMQALQTELRSGTFKEGSPEFTLREKKLAQEASEGEVAKAMLERDLTRKNAKINHQTFLEVQDAVQRFANHYNYTLIVRFSREEMNSTDPQKVMQELNRMVVHYRPEDDITDSVVDFLNRKYKPAVKPTPAPTGAKAPPVGTATRPAGTVPR